MGAGIAQRNLRSVSVVRLSDAPAPLEAYPRFVAARVVVDPKRFGKTIKQPLDWRTGVPCDPTNPNNQTTYANVAKSGHRVGFVFDARDGFFFLDIDYCRDGSKWNARALELCNLFEHAAAEVSQSGNGLHIVGRYGGAAPPHRKKNVKLGIELYTDKRFMLLGLPEGTRGNVMTDCTPALHALIAKYFAPSSTGIDAGGVGVWTDGPCEGYNGPADDDALLRMMLASGRRVPEVMFGGAMPKFQALWTADAEGLGRLYPSATGQYWDRSSADAALASSLSYWTGKDCGRIKRLMLASGLMRQKWEDRPAYLGATIINAVGQTREIYQPEQSAGLALASNGKMANIGEAVAPREIKATPFVWRAAHTLSRRPYIYGRQLLRGTVSAVIAPGATGKSYLMTGTALALATGRNLLGYEVWEGPKRVWLWNLEDSGDELARGFIAAALHWNIGEADIAGRLFVDSGLDGAELKIAVSNRDGVLIAEPIVASLVTEIRARQIDVLIIDPFVSSHAVNENDNGAIDAVIKKWARIAAETNCSIILVHHSRKNNGAETDAESARGASSMVAAARSVSTLNRMSAPEAEKWGIEGEARRRYFRVYDDKNNRAPPADQSDWFELISVSLGNGLDGGDSIAVVVPWVSPSQATMLSDEDICNIQRLVGEDEWRENVQSGQWVGHAVGRALGLSLLACGEKAKVKGLIKSLITTGRLAVVRKKDANGDPRPFIIVGNWINRIDPHVEKRGADKCGGAVETPDPHPHPPL